jgi:hypothetical protein
MKWFGYRVIRRIKEGRLRKKKGDCILEKSEYRNLYLLSH